jgi:membrane associated rhomboid family serine protease
MGRAWAPRLRHLPGTYGLLLVCTLVFAATLTWTLAVSPAPGRAAYESLWQLENPQIIADLGGLVATRIWLDHQWWRLLSASVIHGSWLHFLLNMSALWVLGVWTEVALGWRRMLSVFVLTSTIGCLASLSLAEAPIVVGASAGIFGLGGALVVARRFGTFEVQKRIAPVRHRRLAIGLVGWILVGFALPLFDGLPLIAQAGHIGGFVSGLVMGWAWSRDKHLKLQRILPICAMCATVLVGGWMAHRPAAWPEYHAWIGLEHLRRGDVDAGLAALERGLELAPEDHELQNAVAYELAESDRHLVRAEELVLAALDERPDSAAYLDTLGWIQCKRGDVESGKATLERAGAAFEGDFVEQIEHLARCDSVAPQ